MSCNYIMMTAMAAAGVINKEPSLDQTRFLAHFEGPINVEVYQFFDGLGREYRTNGGTRISGDGRFGGTSLSFGRDGGTFFLPQTADGDILGLGDFTLEAWIKPERDFYQSGLTGLFLLNGAGGFSVYFDIGRHVLFSSQDGTLHGRSAEPVMVSGSWQHIALSRANGKLVVWFSGKKQLEFDASLLDIQTKEIWVGYCNPRGSYGYMTGLIDEFRYVKGLAVYTEEFTPLDTEFPIPT